MPATLAMCRLDKISSAAPPPAPIPCSSPAPSSASPASRPSASSAPLFPSPVPTITSAPSHTYTLVPNTHTVPHITSTLTSISIGLRLRGTPALSNAADHFGFFAQTMGKLSVTGATISLDPNPHTDNLLLGPT